MQIIQNKDINSCDITEYFSRILCAVTGHQERISGRLLVRLSTDQKMHNMLLNYSIGYI